jgi:hypothetical protein
MEMSTVLPQFVYNRVSSVEEEDLEDTINMFNCFYSNREQQLIKQKWQIVQ